MLRNKFIIIIIGAAINSHEHAENLSEIRSITQVALEILMVKSVEGE